MCNGTTTQDVKCELHQFERNRYFYGKLMTVRDFETEQLYVREPRYLHNQALHGCGVVCGLTVNAGNGTKVSVTPGIALCRYGREIILAKDQEVDLSAYQTKIDNLMATGKNIVYLCIKYDECTREPVPALANVSTCQEVCDYNRIQENFAFEVLTETEWQAIAPVPTKACETWMNLTGVSSDITEGTQVIAEFERITPRWVKQGDVFEVRRKIKPTASGKTISVTDQIPTGFTLIDGSLTLTVANTIEGKIFQSSYLVKVGNTVTFEKYVINGTVLQSPPSNLNPSEIEIIASAADLEQQIQEELFNKCFAECPDCDDDPNSRCVVLARIALQKSGTSFIVPNDDAIDNVVFDATKGIYRQLVYPMPLVVDLLDCLKKRPMEQLGAQIVVKDDNNPIISAVNSLNFLGGLDAVDGSQGQANISANVGKGLKIVGDQIQPDYAATVTAGKVCEANDPRLSDARAPLAHHTTHENGGSDKINVTNLSGVLADAQKIMVQDEGNSVATRSQLNFMGPGVTASDDAPHNRVNINIPGGAAARIFRGLIEVKFEDVGTPTGFIEPQTFVVDDLKPGEPFSVILAPQLPRNVDEMLSGLRKQNGFQFLFGSAPGLNFNRIFTAFVPSNPYNKTFTIEGYAPLIQVALQGKPLLLVCWIIAGAKDVAVRPVRDIIIDVIKNNPGITFDDISGKLEIDKDALKLELERLLKDEIIKEAGGQYTRV